MSRKTRNQHQEASDTTSDWSQMSTDDAEEPQLVDETVNNIVRYIIYRIADQSMFGKSELVKNVIHKSNMKFEDILNKVKEILRKTYGFNLLIVETAKGRDKNYIVSNALPYVSDPDDDVNNEYPPDANKILLLLILTHTFMMNNSVSEVSLVGFLKKLGIDVEAKHPIFGNVKDYIAKTLVKKHYLNVTGDPITKIQTFSWGPAAETEISMQAILEFVCRVYKNRQPKDWINQFQIASKQNFRNKPEERNFDSLQ